MARYGKTPIPLPKGVELKVQDGQLTAKGPKGTLNLALPHGISIKIENENVFVESDEAANLTKPTHGLYRSMISNMVKGVNSGYEKRLSLVGVGYRAALSGNSLDLQLGFSHPLKVEIPKELKIAIDKSVLIVISGIDKQIVGQFAAQVRALRPPEPYKGKGIRYENEYVRKKAGKAAKGKGAPGA
ncbi:MAG TPA: 50S ribosomal protein L6 [Rhabdochlamydiaceae bacterium]|nr:50S ribosomal protein L6 [Rhabdochlamydiaceae bacterium]